MECPACDNFVSHSVIVEYDLDGGDEFNCPSCNVELRYIVDEGTYLGAQVRSLELLDE